MVEEGDPKDFYKVLITGTSEVGKTSLWHRFVYGNAPDVSPQRTIGYDEAKLLVSLDDSGQEFVLSFMDTAGLEAHQGGLMPCFYRFVDALILVYDVSRPKTLRDIRNIWAPEARNFCVNPDQVPWIVIANKMDLVRNVTEEAGRELARELGAVAFHETSASLTDQSVFEAIILDIANRVKNRKSSPRERKSSYKYSCSAPSMLHNTQNGVRYRGSSLSAYRRITTDGSFLLSHKNRQNAARKKAEEKQCCS